MAENWIEKINDKLDELGLTPDLEAREVQGNPDVVVLEDTQTITVYFSPEGVYRLLSLLRPSDEDDPRAIFEMVGQALHSNVLGDDDAQRVEWSSVDGYYWF